MTFRNQSGVSGSHDEPKAKAPGVVTGRYGTIGELFYIEKDFWPLNTSLYVKDFKGNIPRYIYYFLHSVMFSQFSDKSSVPGVNRNHLHAIEVSFERSREAQRSVAKILGDLDDKIELLREMNRTLEEIARAVFRAWFVDFEPVRAKAAGATSFRGMPQEIFDGLPIGFADSSVGPIPMGWQVCALGQLVEFRNERIKPGPETEALPYVPIDSISARSIFLAGHKPGTEAQSSLIRVYPEDILFGAMRPYFHKVCISPFEATTRTTVFVLKARVPWDLIYCLMLLSEDKTIEFATSSSIGSTIPYAKWEGVLERMAVALPPPKIRKAFGDALTPLIKRGMRAKAEVETLTSIRDVLLPKLISGEIEAPSLEALGIKTAGNAG